MLHISQISFYFCSEVEFLSRICFLSLYLKVSIGIQAPGVMFRWTMR